MVGIARLLNLQPSFFMPCFVRDIIIVELDAVVRGFDNSYLKYLLEGICSLSLEGGRNNSLARDHVANDAFNCFSTLSNA